MNNDAGKPGPSNEVPRWILEEKLKAAEALLVRVEGQLAYCSGVFNASNFTDRGQVGPGLKKSLHDVREFLGYF
jgi:hypothetical protein